MNLKTVLFSTLIIAIAYTICVEARTRHKSQHSSSSNKKKTVTHHRGNGHNKGDSTHHSSESHPKQNTHKTNTGHAANTHADTSHRPNQAVLNTHTDTSHSSNQPVAYHHTGTSHIPNQPVYVVHVQQQNSHSSRNDDFEEGYDAGVAAARRIFKRRTTTTTTTTVAPKTTKSTTLAPTTTKNPCLNEVPMPGTEHNSSPHSYATQQTLNPYNLEVGNPSLNGLQNPNQVAYDVNLQQHNVYTFGNNPNNGDVSNPPSDNWQNPNQPAHFVNLQQQNPHASGNGPMPNYNQPQQQNPVVNCGFISPFTDSINISNTSVNNNGLQ